MKSKEILPETERLPEDYFKFFKKDDLLARYHRALAAAESQLSQANGHLKLYVYKCRYSGESFRINPQGTFWAWHTSTTEAQPFPIKKACMGLPGRAYFSTEAAAIEWNKNKFNW